ncbi:MAG: hypothetical protein U5Q44_11035 [Dehalococcoidia bacterium]|nr:hypothetical protein [Dehalococcoidia bacterium]
MLGGPATPELDRREVIDTLLALLHLDGLEVDERDVLAEAFRTYRDANIDFADAYRTRPQCVHAANTNYGASTGTSIA